LQRLPDPLAGFKGKGEARGRGEGGDRRGRGQKMEGKGRWGRERGERARKGETERRGEMGVGREIWPPLSFILVGAYRRKAAYPQELSSPFPCTVRLYINFYSYFLQTKSGQERQGTKEGGKREGRRKKERREKGQGREKRKRGEKWEWGGKSGPHCHLY